jgi:TetR/AcrR family transcriptional repressor of nem operon
MRKKYNKEDIIAIGQELVRRNGYTNTGINDVLKESGIPKGSFYNFFESKAVFGEQLLKHYGDVSLELIESHLGDHTKSPLQRLRSFYQHVIEINEAEECRNGCLINNLSGEVGGINDRLGKVASQQFNRLVQRIAQCLREGQEADEIIQHQTAEEIAYFIHASFFGALTRAKAARNAKPLNIAYKMIFDFITKD